ncbi:hypothetical protein J7E73_32310 [Paenibacillus albidus]|uniref:hypothetical protein n=1 Tax=Paenibacillus albidus TaxID=2041023 RepID=UPI001BE8EC57|nr:hypothetical protein [Paenibacillus albidus]MBT2293696.1 hypothetical protein [Paenibacillus albidus]
MAYMLTWANFNYESIFVPYRGAVQHGDHELLPDFEQYYDDPYTYFSQDLNECIQSRGYCGCQSRFEREEYRAYRQSLRS